MPCIQIFPWITKLAFNENTNIVNEEQIEAKTEAANNNEECDSNENCVEKESCQYYQDIQTQMNTEQNFTVKITILKHLRSLICNFEKQKVCCPDGNW